MIYYAIKIKNTNKYYWEHYTRGACFDELIDGSQVILFTTINKIIKELQEFKESFCFGDLELEVVKMTISDI